MKKLKKLFLAISLGALVIPVKSVEVNPVLRLSFDNKENIFADSAGSHEAVHSTKSENPEWVPAGKNGGAVKFNGRNTLIHIKDAPDLNFGPNESFTIEARVKINPANDKSVGIIIHKGGKSFWGIRSFTRGRLGFFPGLKGRTLKNRIMLYKANVKDKWVQIAFVRDAAERKLRFYVDGIQQKEIDAPAESEIFSSPGSDLTIGKYGKYAYKGLIDEIIIYKGAKRSFSINGKDGKNADGEKYKPAAPVIEKPDPMIEASWKVLEKYNLNIVPCPKNIKVTGNPMRVTPKKWSVLLKCRGLEPGLEFFNERMELAGGKKLESGIEKENRIIAGTFDSLNKYLEKIGNPSKPPRQGYVIGCFKQGEAERIIVAGTDRTGTLYGLITLGLALKKDGKNPTLRQMAVRDWPDFKYRMANFHIIPGKFRFSNAKKMIDRAFALKFNMLQGTSLYTTVAKLIENSDKVKKYFDYANKRGIRMMVQNHTCVIEDIPKFNPRTMPGYSHIYYPYKTGEGLLADSHYGPGRAFTWSRDDLIKKRGRQLSEMLAKTDGNTVFLHSMDCGGVDNPGNWAKRTPMDKKRWGNDRASAEANLYNLIYNEMIKDHPDLIMVIVEYPYGASYLKNPEIVSWLSKLKKLLSSRIYFCIRECSRDKYLKWLAACGKRPQMIGFEPYPVRTKPFFSCMPRYTRTFYVKDRPEDIYYMFSNSTLKRHFEPKTLVQSEYAWNTEAPGWGWYPGREKAKKITVIDEQVPEINEKLLPRALSIFYGEKAAPYMAKALSTGISANIAVNQSGFKGAAFLPYFKAKAELGEKAVEQMEKAAPLVAGNEKGEFKLLQILFKAAATLNKVKYMQLKARKQLAEGKIEAAEKTITDAREILTATTVPRSYHKRWIPPLLKELDVAKNIGWYRAKKKYLDNIEKKNIKVGVYNYGRHKAIVYSLSNAKGMTTGVFEDPQPDYLKDFDVVIFNACKNTGDVYGDWRKAVREYAENGGIVIFTHNAIGRHPSSSFGKQIFPEICSAYGGQQMKEPELTVKKDIDGAFKPGDKYVHGYFDHLMPVPGKKAEVFIENKFSKPVMVGGKVGRGYVIYTGEIFGLNKKDNDSDLVEDNWKMLFHIIREAKNNALKNNSVLKNNSTSL